MSQLEELPLEDEHEGLHVGIVAVGGAGISILTHLKPHFPFPSRSIAIDLNQLSLDRSKADYTILVGNGQLNPKRSDRIRFLARAAEAPIREAVEGLHFVFLVCGLGGMAGSHITPFVANVLRWMNVQTTAAVILPFAFEGESRHAVARKGLASLRKHVDAVFRLPGDFEEGIGGEALGLEEAIQQRRTAFGTLYRSICYPLLANQMPGLDLEDMRIILSLTGHASFRQIIADRDVSLPEAAREVLERYCKERVDDSAPKGLFVSFGLHRRRANHCREMSDVMNVVKEYITEDSSIIFGAAPKLDDEQTEIVFIFTGQ